MKKLLSLAILLKAGGAAAGLLYVYVLSRILGEAHLGQVLFLVAIAAATAGIANAGHGQFVLREGARDRDSIGSLMHDALSGMLLRLLLLGLALAAGSVAFPTPMLLPTPIVPVMLVIGAGFGATMWLASAALRARGSLTRALLWPGAMLFLLASGLQAAAALFFDHGALSAYAIHLLALLIVATAMMVALPSPFDAGAHSHPPRGLPALTAAQLGQVLFSNLDTLILGWALSLPEAATYFVARRIAGCLPLVFDGLRSALAPGLAQGFRHADRLQFKGLAARANLGFLLIGGAAALPLLTFAAPILAFFNIDRAEAADVLMWLTLAQLGPAIFGATGMMMTMTNQDRARASLVWAIVPLAAVAISVSAEFGLVAVSQAVALAHLALSAVCAFVLARRNAIWPGLTALLHRQLKL